MCQNQAMKRTARLQDHFISVNSISRPEINYIKLCKTLWLSLNSYYYQTLTQWGQFVQPGWFVLSCTYRPRIYSCNIQQIWPDTYYYYFSEVLILLSAWTQRPSLRSIWPIPVKKTNAWWRKPPQFPEAARCEYWTERVILNFRDTIRSTHVMHLEKDSYLT